MSLAEMTSPRRRKVGNHEPELRSAMVYDFEMTGLEALDGREGQGGQDGVEAYVTGRQ
jgi:hypothetical protein